MEFRVDEQSLIKGLNDRHIASFEQLFYKYYTRLCFFAEGILHDEHAARDIVQEAFIDLWNKNVRFDDLNALKSFLYMIVRRKALSYRTKEENRRRIGMTLKYEEYSDMDIDSQITESEFFEILSTAINLLPTECRRIFKLSYIDHLSIKEICDLLGIVESTVKTQRSRAKKVLREVMHKWKNQT